jgi:hypothetical protein
MRDDEPTEGGDGTTGTASEAGATTGPAQQRFRVRPVVRSRRPDRPGNGRRDATDGGDADDRVVSRDETDVGWGDAPGRRDDEWYLRERPPHHGQ